MKWMLLLAAMTIPGNLFAQTAAVNPWTRGTTLEGFIGTATTPTPMNAYGGAFGWELNHRFEVQGLGAWLPRTTRDEFAADLKLLMNLTLPAIFVPYVAAGAGLYQGTFERRDFETYPTAVVGAGAHLYLRRHLSVRPEATMRFAFADGKAHRITTLTFAVTYHFEEHDVGE